MFEHLKQSYYILKILVYQLYKIKIICKTIYRLLFNDILKSAKG